MEFGGGFASTMLRPVDAGGYSASQMSLQTDSVGQLPKEHADHVTPSTEGSRHKIHAGFPRKFRNQMRRNEIAKAVAEH